MTKQEYKKIITDAGGLHKYLNSNEDVTKFSNEIKNFDFTYEDFKDINIFKDKNVELDYIERVSGGTIRENLEEQEIKIAEFAIRHAKELKLKCKN